MTKANALAARAGLVKAFFMLVICASPALADPINLMWDANNDPVAGYIVHAGVQSGTYTQHYDVGLNTAFVYPNATAGQRYCFTVSAYTATGVQSPNSGEACGYSDAPPSLVNPGNQTSQVGSPVALQLNGSDPYGQPVSYSATGLPPGLTLAQTSGFISGAGTTAGSYAVTARAFDGRLTASQSFTWTMSAPPPSAPAISIAVPTAASTYATTGSSITLQGTASAGAGVSQVTWTSDRGASGAASGTTSWTAASIPLQSGVNVVTVFARDANGNQAADALNVTYSIPTSPVMLSGLPSVQKGRRYAALTWTSCPWRFVDLFRDGLRLTVTENDGAYTDTMKKSGSGSYTYHICETGNNANCSNKVAVIF